MSTAYMTPKDALDDSKAQVLHVEKHIAQALPAYIPNLAAERKLIRKIDVRLLPTLWVMYVFNFMDRTNIGNAKVGGMEKDLHLSSSDYSLALSIFFVGYLLNEIPSNMLLARSRPSIFLPGIMIVWGLLTIAAKGVHNLTGLIVLRFFLGFVEAGFFPGVIFLLSCFYKPFELAKRMAIFYSASLMSGAFGGLLAGVITEYMNGVAETSGWQWLFVIEGIVTVIVGIAAIFLLPDYPHNTRWLSPEERMMAQQRLHISNGHEDERSEWQNLKKACSNVKAWAFVFGYMAIVCTATISYFFPTLMKVLGYNSRNAQFMTVPIYTVGLVISNLVCYSSDRMQEKMWHICISTALSAASFIVCLVVKQATVRYVFICFGGSFLWAAQPLYLSLLAPYFPNRHERAVVIALVNGIGNLASVYGAQIWPTKDAPQYRIGFGVVTAMISLGGITTAAIVAIWGKPYNSVNTALSAGPEEPEIDYSERQDKMA